MFLCVCLTFLQSYLYYISVNIYSCSINAGFLFIFVCQQLPEDLNALWAYVTFYGGECQLNFNKKVTHLVVKEPKGVRAPSVRPSD